MTIYQKTVAELYELQKFGIKLGLNSTETLLAKLGDPHLAYPCVHLAGTNGKGSVGAMLEAALLKAGVRVGFYTSPHLVSFCERFRVAGRYITPEEVITLAGQAWGVVDRREPPTFFELVTAMGFLYFQQQKVEVAIVETGLGGRLDATNVCRPVVSVITNIGLEHQEYLGKTYASVAWEKAGIIKPNRPLVHGVMHPTARKVIEARAAELAAPVIRRGREVSFRRRAGGGFDLTGRLWRLEKAHSNLAGRHQAGNACLALGAAEVLAEHGLPLTAAHLRAGLAEVHWPGRLEKWPTAPGEPQLWMDGAHNVNAAQAMIKTLSDVRPQGPLVMVVGVMADKDIAQILKLLTPLADKVIFSRPRYQRAADPEALAQAAPANCPPHEVVQELGAAIQRGRELAGPQGMVLVTGSLFMVGEARALLTGADTSDLP